MKITCYDYDDDGTCDFQGFAEFQIYEITQAPITVADDTRDHKGEHFSARIVHKKNQKLVKSKNPKATVEYKALPIQPLL